MSNHLKKEVDMRYIIFLFLASFFILPAQADEEMEKVTMPATGWPSDYDLVLAEKYIATEAYEDALDVLDDILDRNVKSIDGHALSGFAHFKLNNIERAEKHLFSVIDLDPRHMGAHLYLAEIDIQQNKIPQVEERLQLLKMICEGTDCGEYQYLKRRLRGLNKNKESDENRY